MGGNRSCLPLFGHVAARNEHGFLNRHVLMVFLIQRSQNKDALAMHVKLNEIVKAIEGASNRIVNVEDLSEAELRRLQERYQTLAKRVAKSEPGTTSEIPVRSN